MRYLWLGLGFISFALGTVGIILPILPTVPFYMLTLFCFAKGSKRICQWFKETTLYKKYVEDFVQNKVMTRKAKLKVIFMVTVAMSMALYLMPADIFIGYIIIVLAWIIHVVYLTFGIKTAK